MDKQTVYETLADVLRCTDFIPEREIRAKYVVTDMRLRGFILQEVRRDLRGRFAAPLPKEMP